MKVEIVSIHAALAGRPSILWTGDVKGEDLVHVAGHGLTDTQGRIEAERMNNALFRYFNRVDVEDEERLEASDYRLPSLSVGDLLHWGSKTWRVAGTGFEQITDSSEYAMALTAYTLKTINHDTEGSTT